ncbi:putative threonine efflux protein [Nitrincola lacisaponensis]|uniref:Putative threonine efflux protein n=1 Tax=Nitrincola lacisaponensis TaxID=267850 RepID=A0A063Y3R9_9GAMM|nr:LysE family translocator [Nitrincola lacisaponensis]KDE40334.1 putative threonine efflux protein [Nitrincola lacisaponensis]
MSIEGAITYFIAIFIFAITPGPGIFALLARGMSSGFRSCIPLAAGMTLGDLLYLTLAFFGLAALAEHWNEAFTVIRLVGAAYLLWLGWKMWTTPIALSQISEDKSRIGMLKGFLQGFLISSSNPKVILFYIAFLPSFIDLSRLTRQDLLLVNSLTVAALMTGLLLIAGGIATARKLFRSERSMKVINRSAGSLMMAAGLYLAGKSG